MSLDKQMIEEDIINSGIVSLDMEHNPDYSWMDPDFRQNFWGSGLSYLKDGKVISYWIRDFEMIQHILDVVCDNQIPVVGHFFQADMLAFMGAGFVFKKDPEVRCTAIAYNMLFEELSESELGLKSLASQILKKERTDFLTNAIYGPDSPEFERYAKDDVEDQLNLYLLAEPALKKINVFDAYLIVSGSIVPFSDMMFSGMPFSIEVAEELYYKFCTLKDEIERNIYQMIGRIDINSPKQLARRLFDELQYFHPKLKKTPKGQISTDVVNIEMLAEKYPVCELISAYRTCNKMISTYIEPFVEQYERYGRVYDYYYLTSRTGRTSTKRIQLIPNELGRNIKHNQMLKAAFNDLKLRRMFKAPEGKRLVIRDFSSLEYRTAAIAANDPVMIDMYQSYDCKTCGNQGKTNKVVRTCPKCGESNSKNFFQGKDLHAFVRDLCNDMGANITRQEAKAISFCIIFHGSPYKIASYLGFTKQEAIRTQQSLLDRFPGIKKWHDSAYLALKKDGVLYEPMFGRRRKTDLKKRLEQSFKSNPDTDVEYITKKCAKELINATAQMPACILGQICVKNIRARLKKEGLWGKARVIDFVHDEIGVECDEDIADYVDELVREEMETSVEVDTPFPTEGGVFFDWAECKG
jgi:DNA polymerase I-like protein with 3'-5' exonuclease and polymerase domains